MKTNRYKRPAPRTEEQERQRDLERTATWLAKRVQQGTVHEYRVLCASGHVNGRGTLVRV